MFRAIGCLGSIVLLVAAGVGGYTAGERMVPETLPKTAVPLPHHHPPTAGGASFRFAMAHDVIHERYPKHGPAFYTERNRLARERLTHIPPDSDEAFALTDDIGAGLTRLGQPADAVALMRAKWALQEKRGLTGRDLYTTYANLGTFLFFAHIGKALRGDADARAGVQEGLELVEKAIAVNPDSHFGREKWQAELTRFLLKAIDTPDLLTTTDCIGNRLDRTFPAEDFLPASAFRKQEGTARPYFTTDLMSGADHISHDRDGITRVGWASENNTSRYKAEGVPFDEPMLGVIGMWRQGAGPHPHFALCVGEVMLRVGQRYIAWAALERAAKLAEGYWPDPAKQQFLRDHCGRRQKQIEETLPAGEVPGLRPRFEAEVAHGERYQREYQEYEAAKIAAGGDIRDEHFFDDFHQDREPIATPPGPEEWLVTERIDYVGPKVAGLAGAVFAVGLVAFVLAVGWPRRKR
jgi:hypothetical protein